MGVECSSRTVVGVYAGHSMSDVLDLLIELGVLRDEEEYEDDFYGCHETMLNSKKIYDGELSLVCENLYSGEGYYMGYDTTDWRKFQSYIDRFNALTGLDGDVHNFERWH